MKRIIYLFLLLMICSIHYAYGDEVKSIKLDNKDHRKETVALPFCNIFVELQQGNEDGQYEISVKMENISEDKILCLFDRGYTEKLLKKMGIVYDRFFPGTKKKRIAEACDSLSKPYRFLPSSETENIIKIQYNDNTDNTIKCRLPIYIARKEQKKFLIDKRTRISLAEKDVIELDIDVKIKPDEDLIRLSAATDSLIDEIGKQTFCSNKNHRGPSLKQLHSKYNQAIEDLKGQINQIIRSRSYMSTDKGYKDFYAIYEKLDGIKLEQRTVASCNNDKKAGPTHNCKYCSLSAEDIYKRIESYYFALYNGKKSKEQVMTDVEALYNCAQKNKKRSTGDFMQKITKVYNSIQSK